MRYPTASSPQAWATAAPFLWFRLVLGLEPHNGKLTVDPVVPEELGRVEMKGLHAFGSRRDVKAWKKTGSVRKQAGGSAS